MLRASANQTKTRGTLPIKLLISANPVKAEAAFDDGDMLKNFVRNIVLYYNVKRVVTKGLTFEERHNSNYFLYGIDFSSLPRGLRGIMAVYDNLHEKY